MPKNFVGRIEGLYFNGLYPTFRNNETANSGIMDFSKSLENKEFSLIVSPLGGSNFRHA